MSSTSKIMRTTTSCSKVSTRRGRLRLVTRASSSSASVPVYKKQTLTLATTSIVTAASLTVMGVGPALADVDFEVTNKDPYGKVTISKLRTKGESVSSKVKLDMKGNDAGTHFFVVVDAPAVAAGEAVPAGAIDYADGGSSFTTEIVPGKHTLSLQLAGKDGKATDVSKQYTVFARSSVTDDVLGSGDKAREQLRVADEKKAARMAAAK